MSQAVQSAKLAVYTILTKEDGRVAFVMRSHKSWMNLHYSLPAGRVQPGEDILTAAIREAREESGVTILPQDMVHVLTMHRNQHDQDTTWIDIFFKAKNWSGDPYNAEPNEHSSLEWLDPNSLPQNVIPMQAEGVLKITKGDSYVGYEW